MSSQPLEGWRYAFLQGVNKSHAKLVREGLPFDVTLFTVLPDKSRQYVAHVSDVEVLNDGQADMALEAFRASGWLDRMKDAPHLILTGICLQGEAFLRRTISTRLR